MATQQFIISSHEIQEEWRPVVGLEGRYEVSNLGRVRSLDGLGEGGRFKGKVLRPSTHQKGYVQVNLCGVDKIIVRKVHILVAAAFIGPRPLKKQTNHKDTNKKNNRFDNLEYVTPKQNVQHAIRNGLWGKKKRRIEADGE